MISQKQDPKTRDTTPYRQLSNKGVRLTHFEEKPILVIEPEALEKLAFEAFHDLSFFLRPAHLQQMAEILNDSEASENDRFVARAFLENAEIAAEGILPTCQDTGTAIVLGQKGAQIWAPFDEQAALSQGIARCYQTLNLRQSQMAPLSMFEEQNTGNNLPAQIHLDAQEGLEYHFTFIAKGGGSANKSVLYQKTKALLHPDALDAFLRKEVLRIGTAACPPYHLAVVIGGSSAEETMHILKKASAGDLDNLPHSGDRSGRAFRDLEWEKKILSITRNSGIGAQFGGKYFCLDVRVIRLPRHAASCPVGIGVSCAADRNIRGKITPEGLFLEQLETQPSRYLSKHKKESDTSPSIDLNRPIEEVLAELSNYPIRTRLRLNGTLIVARDAAHARILEMLRCGDPMPDYFKQHPIYYAGPARKPEGKPSGSFGPTTAQRMDPYVETFMAHGGGKIMIAKGDRSPEVAQSCRKHGGVYLGALGGPAALLAERHIRKVETVAFEDLGMEAIRKIEVVNFPAILLIDSQGNDFFSAFR